MFYAFAQVVALTAVAACRERLGVEVAGAATTTQVAHDMGKEEAEVAGYTCEFFCAALAPSLEQRALKVHPSHTQKMHEVIAVTAK